MGKSGQSISDARRDARALVRPSKGTVYRASNTAPVTSIGDTAEKIMQNRGGATKACAEARNYFYGGDRNHSCGGIFSDAAPAAARAWLARPDRTPVRRVPDVPWRRACNHLLQSAGLDRLYSAR